MAKTKKPVELSEDVQPEVTKTEVVKETKPVKKNEAKAKEIFEAMPHIHTVWFSEDGHHRFYETPGAKAVEKGDL